MRQIQFEDIRKGDDIEARWTLDGLHLTRRGIAHHQNPYVWYTEEGGSLAARDGGWTHYLHHRPAPAEPKGLGAVVRARVTVLTYDPEAVRTLVRTAVPGTPWADERQYFWRWSDLASDSIEVLSEGNEEDQ